MCAGSVGKAVSGLVCGELWKRWRGGRGIKADRRQRIEAIGLSIAETYKERRNGEGKKQGEGRRGETGLGEGCAQD